jgi:hypothetical protein
VRLTRPFEALDGARRDRIEFEKRATQDRIQQQQKEREQKAKQVAEKRSEAAVKRAQGGRPAGTSSPAEKDSGLDAVPKSLSCTVSRSGALSAGAEEGRSPGKRDELLTSPLGDDGRGSRRRSLTLALPNGACPDAHESDGGENNKACFCHFWRPRPSC